MGRNYVLLSVKSGAIVSAIGASGKGRLLQKTLGSKCLYGLAGTVHGKALLSLH
jgi:hypothetical protein